MTQRSDLMTLRVYDTKNDKNFIFSTWLRGLRYGNDWFLSVNNDVYFECYHKVIERILAHPDAQVVVACLKDDPEVILGYSVTRFINDKTVLDWVFVKKAWRSIGIAKALVPEKIETVTHLTKVGKAILSKSPYVFNPFL